MLRGVWLMLLTFAGCGDSHEAARTTLSGLSELSQASQDLAASVAPSVVRIDVQSTAQANTGEDELRQLFGDIREPASQGSGIIVSADGLILTNYHVVRNAELASVTLDEERVVTGRVVGVDALTDLALIRVPVQGLSVAKWGDSDDLNPGEFVWVIGSPFGLQRSITFGILSARQGSGVTKSPFYDFLQTDAVVNPGNSGGPLVNSRGEVVGVTTTILGATYQGVSFAIPARIAREVAAKLEKEGRISRGWLGVTLAPVDDELARRLGLPAPHGIYVRALVSRTDAVSPAATAGLMPGDVILQWNGQVVEGVAPFARRVAATPAGSNIQVTVFREGQKLTLNLQVAEHP